MTATDARLAFFVARVPSLLRDRMSRAATDGDQLAEALSLGEVPIETLGLLRSARALLDSGEDQPLVGLDDTKLVLLLHEGRPAVRMPGREEPQFLDALLVLSREADVRVRALRTLQKQAGATAIGLSEVVAPAAERELTDLEAVEALNAVGSGIAAEQRRIVQLLKDGQATLADLVPRDPDYYVKLLGPIPAPDVSAECYCSTTLADYRQQLLASDRLDAISICLRGAVHPSLDPSSWLADSEEARVVAELESAQPQRDPLSAIAALRVLRRRTTGEAERLRESLLGRLKEWLVLDEEKPSATLALLGALVELVSNRLAVVPGLASTAPYWRWLATWLHACWLLGVLEEHGVVSDGLIEAAEKAHAAAGMLLVQLDARQIIAPALRWESSRLRAYLSAQVLDALDVPRDPGAATLAAPDPFLLASRPRAAIGTDLVDLMRSPAEFRDRLRVFASVGIANRIPEDLVAALALDVRRVGDGDLSGALEELTILATVAATQRTHELSQAVLRALAAVSPRLTQPPEVGEAVRIVVLATACKEDPTDWKDMTALELTRLARALPPGPACAALGRFLETIRALLPVESDVTGAALANASLGSR